MQTSLSRKAHGKPNSTTDRSIHSTYNIIHISRERESRSVFPRPAAPPSCERDNDALIRLEVRRHFAPCYLPSTLALFPRVVRSPGGVGGEGEAGFLGWRATRPIARADSTRLHIVQTYASIMDYGDGRCINGYRNLYTLVWSRVELYRLAAALIRLESPIRMRKTNGKRLEIWLFDKVKKENAKLQKLPSASTTLLLSTVSESNRYLYSEKMSIYWNRFLYHFDQTEKKSEQKKYKQKKM